MTALQFPIAGFYPPVGNNLRNGFISIFIVFNGLQAIKCNLLLVKKLATHVVNKKLHVIIEFLCQNVDVYETLVRLRGATVAQFSLAETVLPSVATFNFWGSSLVKNRLFKINLNDIF